MRFANDFNGLSKIKENSFSSLPLKDVIALYRGKNEMIWLR